MNTLERMSDDQLVSLYVGGTSEAFDVIVDRYKDTIFTYIIRVVKDEYIANDIFQETFVKVITNVMQGRYTANGRFSQWVYRIAHNCIIDHYRHVRNENLQSTDTGEMSVLNRKQYSEAAVEDVIIDDQIKADLHRLVRALPDNQRQVLLMRYYRDMSYKEIAEETKVSINTALGRMRYALMNLRRMAEENHIALTAQ
ncbi:MAG: sigma-70 family RNA polymerase sigma factor [Muribaculaceae bacterium]|nr:sigma-70 family RNA polymerase sigma factor [Muribaculaceae bacterium]